MEQETRTLVAQPLTRAPSPVTSIRARSWKRSHIPPLIGKLSPAASITSPKGAKAARVGISVGWGRPYPMPHSFDLMERHPFGSQAFVPMRGDAFLVVVAPDAGDRPGAPVAFVTAPGQGVNYLRGTWHGVLTPLGQAAPFLIVDRVGGGPNLDEFRFDAPWTVLAG